MKNFWEDVVTVFKQNSTLLTVFAVIIIVLTGVTLIENPSMWWTSLLLTLVFCVTVFLFMNAKAVFKTVLSFIVLSFTVLFSYLFSGVFTQDYANGFIWSLSLMSIFFFNLAFSYYCPGGISRWGVNTIANITGFLTTMAFLVKDQLILGIILGSLVQLLGFILIYRASRKTRFNKKNVPTIGYNMDDITTLIETLENTSVQCSINSNRYFTSVILWDDDYAIQVTPVIMQTGFHDTKKGLTYLDSPINPWLLHVSFKMSALWGVRKIPIFNILLDSKNMNGRESKTIGVSIPDTRRVLPLGVMPARNLTLKGEQLFYKSVKEYEDFLTPLTPKQRKHLLKLNK